MVAAKFLEDEAPSNAAWSRPAPPPPPPPPRLSFTWSLVCAAEECAHHAMLALARTRANQRAARTRTGACAQSQSPCDACTIGPGVSFRARARMNPQAEAPKRCFCAQGAHRRRQRRRDQRARGPRRAARKMQSDAHKSEKDAITRDRDIAICCASRGCKLAQESARLPTNAVRVTPANTRIPQSTTRTSLRTSGRQTKSG